MITTPNTKVLCYGDSNTWGLAANASDRYPADIRWTGVLQNILGQEFEIIEEGLNSRTTNIDDPMRPDRNGFVYFRQCIESHRPEICILWLGTNDLKVHLSRNAAEIIAAKKELISFANEKYPDVKIILVAPPISLHTEISNGWGFTHPDMTEMCQEISRGYALLAEEFECTFVSLFPEIVPGMPDGIHITPEGHARVAEIFAKIIIKI